MKMGSIYSASDKALFDALNQATVTNAELRQLFLSHGIIISRFTERKELAAHFSRLVHDYEDFQALAKLFDKGQKRERLASFRVLSTANLDDFESAAHEVIRKLKETDAASISKNDDGTFKIVMRYKVLHFDKSEFKQVETRNAIITIEMEGGALVIRGPQNEKVDEVCRDLIAQVASKITGDVEIDEISLEHLPAAVHRTLFFISLIESVKGYKKHDVTDVFVYKPKIKTDPDAEITEDISNEEIDLGIHISRASLKGEGVLESSEMKGLIASGFYISKIIWQTKETGLIDPDIFEFEAQFSEPESCTRFSYLVRGYYKYQGNHLFSKSKTQLSASEDLELSKAIEFAARTSLRGLSSDSKEPSK